MPRSEPPDSLVIARYLAGESNTAERQYVDTWASTTVENARWLTTMGQLWSADPTVRGTWDLERLWCQVMDDANREVKRPDVRLKSMWPRRIATLSAVALMSAALLWARGKSSHLTTTMSPRTYATAANQRAIVRLDDGTQVTLSPQTTLRIIRFDAHARAVSLDGEAYFEIPHASGTPFSVQSGAVTAQVLGTAFLVRHDVGRSRVRVAVTDGKLRVASSLHQALSLTLSAGYVGVINDSTALIDTIGELSPGTEWRQGEVIFHDTPAIEVLQVLQRWYGYRFHYTDSAIVAKTVTLGLSTRSSSAALATLEQVLNVNLTVMGDTIMLARQPSHPVKGVPRSRGYDVWTPAREVGR